MAPRASNPKPGRVAVYRLYDPENPDGPFYFGSSSSPERRLDNHCSPSSVGRVGKWLQSMKAEGRKPAMEILTWETPRRAGEIELAYYQRHKDNPNCMNDAAPRRFGVKGLGSTIREMTVTAKAGSKGTTVYLPSSWAGKKVHLTVVD